MNSPWGLAKTKWKGGKDMNFLRKTQWSPYAAGALSGVVSIFSVWIAGKYFGASTTFVRSAGMIEKLFGAERVAQMPYFMKELPQIDWQWMFVAGVLIGSLIASTTSGAFCWKAVPDMWEKRFGPSKTKRGTVAFSGGLIAMFGARLADG
jgi:putative effector of murein hydrolase